MRIDRSVTTNPMKAYSDFLESSSMIKRTAASATASVASGVTSEMTVNDMSVMPYSPALI
ncbi:hypothetical protein CE91St33_22390 [Eggerthella lenta]|nr:hypothetical protein CE91St33_22390 [Eggerthella lenta]GKG84278.1 hypothetical protein CE91St34_15390 [Eggerthella lenta]GKG88275.1 hypothetical protein CE91St35_24290 [Eggerthella lenta]